MFLKKKKKDTEDVYVCGWEKTREKKILKIERKWNMVGEEKNNNNNKKL